MNLKTFEHWTKEVCPGRRFDSCEPCVYSGGPSRTHGGFECRHPDNPTNWKTELKTECMYCRVDMGSRNGKGTEGTSHGICPKCWSERFPGIPYPTESEA